MLFDSWNALLRILAVGVPIYFLMIAALRVTGKRALAKMNAYDLVVTVALGSALASTLLSKDVKLAEGAMAVVMLLALQFAVAAASRRWPLVQRAVLAEPALLLYAGVPLERAMRSERITDSELLSAVRSRGHMNLDDVQAVVLEPDGSFSVMPRQAAGEATAMKSVAHYPALSQLGLHASSNGGLRSEKAGRNS
jgi:uncharacterized membrane protein YcaP (DUF421 family)